MGDKKKTGSGLPADMKNSPGRNPGSMAPGNEDEEKKDGFSVPEDTYRDLVENASIAILIDDKEGNIVYANQKAAELYGYPPEQMRHQAIETLVHPDDVEMVTGFHRNRLKGKAVPATYVFRGLKKDGSVRHLEVMVSPILKGKVAVGSRIYVEDITERRQTEEALRNSEERFRILFEYAPDGYYLNDVKGRFIDGNRAAEQLTGYKKDELVGKSFLKLHLLSPKDIPRAARLLVKNAMRKPTGPDEFVLNRKNGTRVAVEIRTYPVKIKGQTLVLGNVRDITERKRADEQIRKSLEEKDILLKEIHHRVKNNLQIISSLLRIKAAGIADRKTQEVFDDIHDRIKSMAILYEMQHQSQELASVDLAEYIKKLTAHLFSMYRKRAENVRLRVNVTDVPLDLKKAIPCGLIVTELVSNSLKHAFPSGGEGEISVEICRDRKGKSTLTVRDTGTGLPEGIDFRSSPSLGLKLVMDLIQQLNGTVEVGRENGTEFKIVFAS